MKLLIRAALVYTSLMDYDYVLAGRMCSKAMTERKVGNQKMKLEIGFSSSSTSLEIPEELPENYPNDYEA